MCLKATDRGKYVKVSGYNIIDDRWDIFEETHLIVIYGISYEGCIDILWLVALGGRRTWARLKCMPFRFPMLLLQKFNGTLACHPYEASQLFLVADMSSNPESAEKFEKMSGYQLKRLNTCRFDLICP